MLRSTGAFDGAEPKTLLWEEEAVAVKDAGPETESVGIGIGTIVHLSRINTITWVEFRNPIEIPTSYN